MPNVPWLCQTPATYVRIRADSGKTWALLAIGERHTVAVLVVLLLASIIFLSTALLVIALMLRNRWDDLGKSPRRDRRA